MKPCSIYRKLRPSMGEMNQQGEFAQTLNHPDESAVVV